MSATHPIILTIGKATQDVFLRSKVFKAHKEDGVLYEHLPLGAKLDIEEAVFATGGNATNAATTFARQGLHSKYVWALGHDMPSNVILQELDTEGIDTSHVVQDEAHRASYSTILLSPDGERTILNFQGVKVEKDGHPLDLSIIGEVDWLYISSVGSMELLEKVIALAAKNNTKIMFNPAGSELAHPAKLKTLLEDVEILALNKEEMQLLVEGQDSEELIRHGHHLCPIIIISDGPQGVVATDGKTIVNAGMYEDVPVIDRTGAGDAFGSGFLSQWVKGKDLAESVVFASANSTSVVGQIGAKAGILHKGTALHGMSLSAKTF
jgi:sugar/nucleoside kinase (ribokinase family)